MLHHRNFQLKKYNSFGLDSIAKKAWFPTTIGELQDTLKELKGEKFEVLGGGTNVLLSPKIDRVICLERLPMGLQFFSTVTMVSANIFTSYFIKKAIEHKFKGIEGLIGIPGTVGGGIIMNSGSGKYCISDYLLAITTVDYDGDLHIYPAKLLNFKRRYSILQDKKQILTHACFDFERGEIDQNKIKQVKDYRKDFPKGYSVGGIFKNWHALNPYEKEIRAIKSPNLVISKYLNIIINNGKATFQETIDFINQIRKIVKEPLELEVKILGDK